MFDSCCRIFDQQFDLVGTVPLTISALTGLTRLYAPAETCFDCFEVHFVCACVCMGEPACSRLQLCGHSPTRIGLRNCCGCVIRRLTQTRLAGPFPAGITALTMLTHLYAPPCAVRCPGWDGGRRCRLLGNNHFTGSVPSTISALYRLETLCAPPNLILRPHVSRFGASHAFELVGFYLPRVKGSLWCRFVGIGAMRVSIGRWLTISSAVPALRLSQR